MLIYLSDRYAHTFIILTIFLFNFMFFIDSAIAQKNNSDTNTINGLSFQELFKQVKNSIVQVTYIDLNNPLNSRLGSGFVYDYDGHIITNAHVALIPDGGIQELQVTFLDGKTYTASIVGADPFTDVAVLKIKDPYLVKLYPLSLGDSKVLEVGETVVAIGNPFGLSGSMSSGIVSGLGRLLPANEENVLGQTPLQTFSMSDIIQTDAAINPGNSGGPLLNLRGQVIGMNTAIFSNTGVYSGVGFAVPSQTIKKVVPSIVKTGIYEHPFIGVIGLDINPEVASKLGLPLDHGFLVTGITPKSPAEKYKIHAAKRTKSFDGDISFTGGDVIVKIDGIDVTKIDSILTYLERDKQIGDKIMLTIYRDGAYKEIELVLEKRPTFNPDEDNNQLNNDYKNSQDNSNLDPDKNSSKDSYSECSKFFGQDICDFIFRK